MNKKGFMFVETILVVTVLTTSLIMIYVSYSRVLTNEKRRATFDDTAYIYRTYYLEDYLVSLNLEQYIKKNLVNANKKIIVLNPSDDSLYNFYQNGHMNSDEILKQQFSEKIIYDYLKVSKIYITYYNVNDLKQCTSKSGKATCEQESMSAINSMNTNAILYLRTLSGTDDGYRIIVEYNEETIDYSISTNPKSGACNTGYKLISGKCYKQVNKNYYNSVKLATRGR